MATTKEREEAKRHAASTVRPGLGEALEAENLVYGDRQAAYGPHEAYEAQAKAWSGVLAHKLKADLSPEDVVLLLTTMKIVREARRPKRDNVVDIHGYGLVYSRVQARA